MSPDLKCFLGMHKYDCVDTVDTLNAYGINIGTTYVLRCKNCGKMKEKTIYKHQEYKQR